MFRILQLSYTLHIFCRAQHHIIFWSTAPPPHLKEIPFAVSHIQNSALGWK